MKSDKIAIDFESWLTGQPYGAASMFDFQAWMVKKTGYKKPKLLPLVRKHMSKVLLSLLTDGAVIYLDDTQIQLKDGVFDRRSSVYQEWLYDELLERRDALDIGEDELARGIIMLVQSPAEERDT